MNISNATSFDLDAVYTLQSELLEYATLITFVVSFLQLATLGILQWSVTRSKSTETRARSVFTPVNLLLLSTVFSNCGGVTGNYVAWIVTDQLSATISVLVSNTCTAILKISMLCYTWRRGYPVIEAIFARSVTAVKCYLAVFILLKVACLVLDGYYNTYTGEPSTTLYITLNCLSTILVVLFAGFDVYVLVSYSAYLARLHVEGFPLDTERLRIISGYGIMSAIVTLVWFVLEEVINLIEWDPENIEQQLALNWILFSYYLLPLAYMWIQLAMKRDLAKRKEREMQGRMQALERARSISNQRVSSGTRSEVNGGRTMSHTIEGRQQMEGMDSSGYLSPFRK
ncbi:hypothetical protein BC830DRAFT_948566 [Chytriomyces sp. MP71]|nr:hypothetical protein BC830DRAFT_948566 [Chytriomyces sp. MP71]